MSALHAALALAIATVWGLTFVSIRSALEVMPPFALSAWRFGLAAFPLVLFVGWPRVPWRWLAAYGLLIALGQFVVLFIAIRLGIPAGLASLVIQTQVFFTVLFAVVFFGEPVGWRPIVGALTAAVGLLLIGLEKAREGSGLALALVIVAAFFWALGNTVAKHVQRHASARGEGAISPLNFSAWSSLLAVPPLVSLAAGVEGATALAIPVSTGLSQLWGHLAVLAYAAQVFGYGFWAWLLMRNDAAAVSPFALWVPVAGMLSTAWVFGERLTALAWTGSAIVLIGLAVAVWPARRLSLTPSSSRAT
ncbi:MAG: EamA family transporter [Casimicrobiaceae bacterium]